jgi:hypothetical protein
MWLPAALALCLLGASTVRAQDEGEKPKKPKKQRQEKAPRPKAEKAEGTVVSVDAEKREIKVRDKNTGETTTFTLDNRSLISFKGPILNGVQPDDTVKLEVAPGDGGVKTVKRATVSRAGVGTPEPTKKNKGNQNKEKQPKKKKKGKKPEADENEGGGDGGGDGGADADW